VWEESRADHRVLSHSEDDCRPSVLTGDCVKAAYACNSMIGLLFANFILLFSTVYALIHHKFNTSFSGFLCLPTNKNVYDFVSHISVKMHLISSMVVIFILYSINCHCIASMAPVLCSTCRLSCTFPYAYSEVSSGVMK